MLISPVACHQVFSVAREAVPLTVSRDSSGIDTVTGAKTPSARIKAHKFFIVVTLVKQMMNTDERDDICLG